MGNKLRNLSRVWLFLIFILIVVLFLHDNVRSTLKAKDHFTLNNYLENPHEYGGHKTEVMGRITSISQNYFYFNVGTKNIKIFGSGIKKPILGETVVFLNFRKDGIIEFDFSNNLNFEAWKKETAENIGLPNITDTSEYYWRF